MRSSSAIPSSVSRIAAVLWVGGVLLTACFDANDDSGDTAGPTPCSREPALTWDNFGRSYMELHCNGCHSSLLPHYRRDGAPPGVDFNTYEMVITWLDRIEARATGDATTMPPAGGPTEPERRQFEEWIACQVRPDKERLEEPE